MFLDTFTQAFCHPEQAEESIEEDDAGQPSQPPSAARRSTSSTPASHVVLLRDGHSSSSHLSSSSLCCPSFGSRAVLRHFVVHCLQSSSIERVVILSLLFPHSHFTYLASPSSHSHDSQQTAKHKLTVIDAVSDLAFPAGSSTSASNSSTSILQPAALPNPAYHRHLTCSSLLDLSALHTALQELLASGTARSHSVLIVDGLSALLLSHSAPSLVSWLLALRALPSVSLLLHADYACHDALTDDTCTAALHRVAGTRITTTAVRMEKVMQQKTQTVTNAIETDTAIHTTITAHIAHTRSSGRTATKQEQYLLQPTSLTLSATSHAATSPSTQQSADDDITSALKSLMLDQTAVERQRQAKAAVVLPYAHQGDVRVRYGVGGLEVRRVVDEVGLDADDELLEDGEDDDVDDDLDI